MSKKIKLKWFGHSCFKIEIGGMTILLDPIRRNRLLDTTLDPENVKHVSAIFVSHEHWDHNDSETIMSLCSPRTRIYCTESVALSLSHRMTYDAIDLEEHRKLTDRIVTVKPKDVVNLNDVKVKCLGASEGISFIINHGRKLLFMGDSLATEEMIKEKPDVVLFPVWAVRGEEAKLDEFLKLAKGGLCIPMHYHTHADALPNFYINENELKKLMPGSVNMKILVKDEVFEI